MSVDLSTSWLGLKLPHPLVAAAGPLSGTLAGLEALEEAGAAAAVLPSLFEEQIEHEEQEIHGLYLAGAHASPEAEDYFPQLQDYNTGPETYLDLIREAKARFSFPVIPSLNGASPGGWLHYARLFQEAGADAIELNIYFVASDPELSGADVERRYLEIVQQVAQQIEIPLAVKIGPYFSSVGHMARLLGAAGAAGLVLFNRYLDPDLDPETLQVVPCLELTRPGDVRLPLRWIALLRDHVRMSLAASTGVHEAEDAVKLVLAGADVVMLASALLQRGPEHLAQLQEGLESWLDEHGYASLEQAKGSMSRDHCPDPGQFERANYMRALVSYSSLRV